MRHGRYDRHNLGGRTSTTHPRRIWPRLLAWWQDARKGWRLWEEYLEPRYDERGDPAGATVLVAKGGYGSLVLDFALDERKSVGVRREHIRRGGSAYFACPNELVARACVTAYLNGAVHRPPGGHRF